MWRYDRLRGRCYTICGISCHTLSIQVLYTRSEAGHGDGCDMKTMLLCHTRWFVELHESRYSLFIQLCLFSVQDGASAYCLLLLLIVIFCAAAPMAKTPAIGSRQAAQLRPRGCSACLVPSPVTGNDTRQYSMYLAYHNAKHLGHTLL